MVESFRFNAYSESSIEEKTMRIQFKYEFRKLTGFEPMQWQSRLFSEFLKLGKIPAAVDIPTGLGKTSVMAIWYLALKVGANIPRRLVYVVDRRAVVDQATTVGEKLKERSNDNNLCVSTLRGQYVDNRKWLEDPTVPAIVVGTVDMIGSRLLFSGYGVSRKMRPYHAGLLGADTLIVLDESHLVPPFERLLDAIEKGIDAFAPRDQVDRGIVPSFKFLPLSATGRAREGTIFRLEKKEGDFNDEVVKARLNAKKNLIIKSANDKQLDDALAKQAWMLSGNGQKTYRILIYCNSRDVAEKTRKAIEKKAKVGKKEIETELFVGARRVKERVDAAEKLKALGFLAGGNKIDKPSFLIATSAGEVGVDLDADHMICDLVPWERIVQRLGRVNRLGNGNSQVILIHERKPKPKNPENPKPEEKRAMTAWGSLRLLAYMPSRKSGINVNPRALENFKKRANKDFQLREEIAAATTRSPLYPALTRALVDAWSMTSLENHTGRPDVAPWLRGWAEDEVPQTSVVWRKFLPIRSDGNEVSTQEIEAFFDAALPHMSEVLQTETYRVADWLIKRIAKTKLDRENIVAYALAPNGKPLKTYRVQDLLKSENKNLEKQLKQELAEVMLIVDVRLGGLNNGLLDGDVDSADIRTADDGEKWPVGTGFSIHSATADSLDSSVRIAYPFATKRSNEGEDIEYLLIETEATEASRATSINEQLLEEHLSWTEKRARKIAKASGLSGDLAKALTTSARLHDEGKKAPRWQRAFNAPQNSIYAKTRGPFFRQRLSGYRHEFGSLPHAENDSTFNSLPSSMQDLVLHLIATHHGRGRPVIETKGCDDAPPSLLEARACEVTLRSARLQKRWGPWGLAWWEALMRAADQQASRENDKRKIANDRS